MPKRKRFSDSALLTNDKEDKKVFSTPQPPKKVKREISNPKSPKKETPEKGKARRVEAETPQPLHSDNKKTPKSQKVTLKSPKTTPKEKHSSPKINKGTPYPKKEISEDNGESAEKKVKVSNKKNKNKKNKGEKSREPPSKKAKMNGQVKTDKSANQDDQRKVERDAKSLFFKNFPVNFTQSQVKALSPDILKVTLKMRGAKKPIRYAFVLFESKAKAKSNYDKLKGMKLGNQELHVDFVRRDLPPKPVQESSEVVKFDKKRLFVSGLLEEVTEEDIRELFPKMKKVILSRKHAFVAFDDEEDCKKAASDNMQNATLKGNKLVVMYAKKKTRKQRAKKTRKERKAAEKLKKKQEEEEEKSGDDQDDEDDDEDDNEENEEDMDVEDDSDNGDDDDDDDDDDNDDDDDDDDNEEDEDDDDEDDDE